MIQNIDTFTNYCCKSGCLIKLYQHLKHVYHMAQWFYYVHLSQKDSELILKEFCLKTFTAGQAPCLTPVISALWEAEAGRSPECWLLGLKVVDITVFQPGPRKTLSELELHKPLRPPELFLGSAKSSPQIEKRSQRLLEGAHKKAGEEQEAEEAVFAAPEKETATQEAQSPTQIFLPYLLHGRKG
ncbi:hypothetical protein AAY473_009552 [Plecturocebus cupreus]